MAPPLRRVRDLAVYDHRNEASGSSTRVVLVHGAMDRAAGMLRLARRMGNREVVRYDRRGYGRSSEVDPANSFQDHLDDLTAVIDDRPSIVFGHSYGGVIAMAAATRALAPVVGVVSFEAPRAWEPWWSKPPDRSVDPAEAAEHFLRRMIGDDLWQALPERTRIQRRSEGGSMVAELEFQATQQYDPRLIATPLIVGVGALSDERAHRAAHLTVDEAVHAELVVLQDAGHGAHMSHSAELAEIITRADPREPPAQHSESSTA